MSLVLAIDTVTNLCNCGLYRQGVCIGRQSDDLGRGHGEHLINQIDTLLRQTGIDKQSLDHIGVSTGPGSFTGMRVGVAFARGLALALGINAIGVSRFEAINDGLRQFLAEESECKSAVILENVQDLVSYQLFDAGGVALCSPRQEKAAALIQQLPRPLILSGDGCAKLVSLGSHHEFADIEIQPLSREAELDAIATIAATCPVAHPLPAPLYLRAPDAKPMQHNITTNQR